MPPKTEALAIIPARSGSRGIPNKNVKLLAGKPLITYTLEEALQSRHLTRIILSTDSEEIAKIAKDCGIEIPFLRPKALAQDDTPMLPVLQHALNFLERHQDYKPDIVVLLQPTSPFRKAEHIDQAIAKLLDTEADSVVSLCPTEHPPNWMFTLKEDKIQPLLPGELIPLRQLTPRVYRLNGAVYAIRRDVLMKENKMLGADTRAIIMSPENSLDMDTERDFQLAELLLREESKKVASG